MEISKMTLEELQDYALTLEQEKQTLTEQNTSLTNENNELNTINRALQKRNNDLFMRVEQTIKQPVQPSTEPKKVVSCEDFAKTLIKGE